MRADAVSRRVLLQFGRGLHSEHIVGCPPRQCFQSSKRGQAKAHDTPTGVFEAGATDDSSNPAIVARCTALATVRDTRTRGKPSRGRGAGNRIAASAVEGIRGSCGDGSEVPGQGTTNQSLFFICGVV